jgi:hypothetical protein
MLRWRIGDWPNATVEKSPLDSVGDSVPVLGRARSPVIAHLEIAGQECIMFRFSGSVHGRSPEITKHLLVNMSVRIPNAMIATATLLTGSGTAAAAELMICGSSFKCMI